MKEAFREHKFYRKSRELLGHIDAILSRYMAQGYRLTVRQTFYQLVAQDLIPNSQKEYDRVQAVLKNGREAGQIDWDAIEDRTRETVAGSHWESPADIIDAAAASFRLDKWEDQPCHVEVMVEKQALEGILIPVCRSLDVRFSANRGYSSTSLFYDVGKRMGQAGEEGKDLHVLYLGDHDPSGIDMERDLRSRVPLFARQDICVQRLALNIDQVHRYRLPENTAKETDSRYAAYAAEFGPICWELDALEPNVLAELVRTAVARRRDEDLWEEAAAREAAMRNELAQYAADYRESAP